MKYLTFPASAKDSWSLIYEGLLNTPKGFDRKQLRIVVKIQDKLETLAVKTEAGFEFSGVAQVLPLEDAELSVLREALEAVPWRASGARFVCLAFDILDHATSKVPLGVINETEQAKGQS